MKSMMSDNLHIGILGPCSTADLDISSEKKSGMPKGMGGTPVNNLVNELLKRGFKVSVFSLDPSLKGKEEAIIEDGNLTVYYGAFRKSHRPRMFDYFSKEVKALNLFIKRAQPDILHAHWQYEYSSAALKAEIPFVITCHDSPVNVLFHQPGLYRLMRLSMAFNNLRRSVNINAVSRYTAKGNSIFTKAFIDVIPNFEPEWIFNLFTKRELSGKFKIIMINNGFRGRKNVSVGLQAFKLLQEKYIDRIELHLYGGENGRGEEAQKYADSLGLAGGIFFHGKIPFKNLMDELSDGDLFLHTALEESCPMVIIEAMAMG
ncbi:MAG: glycosyltransferase, partial [Flavitalea sp.]